MNISPIQLILPVLGLTAFTAMSTPSFAQEEKGTESTQGVEKGEVQGEAEKIVQEGEEKSDEVDRKKSDLPGNKDKAFKKKTTPEERKLLHDVGKEIGEYRTNKARLKQAYQVAKKNDNQEQLARAEALKPKIEQRHADAMNALNEKYGKERVDRAVAYLETRSATDKKGSGTIRSGGKKKGDTRSDKGKNKAKKRKGKDDSSDS
ncbi:MAG: hypothetical protein ACYTEP_08350 [Planctomycetota bacterium]|jgi:hypothetical protein